MRASKEGLWIGGSSYWPKSDGERYVPGPGAMVMKLLYFWFFCDLHLQNYLFMILASVSYRLIHSEKAHTSPHSIDHWLGDNCLVQVHQWLHHQISTWFVESLWTWWVEDFWFWAFKFGCVILAYFVKILCAFISTWTWNNFLRCLWEHFHFM